MSEARTIQVGRLYADELGESRIESLAIPMSPKDFAPPAAPFKVADAQPAQNYVIIELPVGWGGTEPHPTPGRHMLFMLSGSFRVKPSLGEARTFVAGDGLLMEDTSGKGHMTEVTLDGPVKAVMIRLA